MTEAKKTVEAVAAETEKEVSELIAGIETPESLQAVNNVASSSEASPSGTETAEPNDIQDFHSTDQDASMEDTLVGYKPEETDSSSDGELSLTLTGNMTLKLCYQFEGQEVRIGFKDQSLQVTLTDGTEFKIPVRAKHLKLVS